MFKFKGISSKDMGVVIEEEDLFLARASQKYENIEINGRDGAIFNEYGYSNIEIPMTIQIINTNKLDQIFSWLNGPGIFEYKDRVTTAYFYNEISPQRVVTIKVAEITFIRSPFWLRKNDEFEVVTNKVINQGNIYSKPIIRLEKGNSSIVELTISGIRFIYNFQEDPYVEIDCENYYASYENLNRNRNLEIGFEFPKIMPGTNSITVHSGDSIIKIKNKDRWL